VGGQRRRHRRGGLVPAGGGGRTRWVRTRRRRGGGGKGHRGRQGILAAAHRPGRRADPLRRSGSTGFAAAGRSGRATQRRRRGSHPTTRWCRAWPNRRSVSAPT